MSENFAAEGGQGQINLFEIISNYDRPPLDISGSNIELNYYESILDTSVRAYVTLVDTGYRKEKDSKAMVEEEDVKLTAGEKINLKITDGYGTTLSFLNDKHLILKVPTSTMGTTNRISFNAEIYTPESVNNHLEPFRVKYRYDGKISDTIEKILRDVLKTKKELDIDQTLNSLSVLPANTKPFYQCAWLAPRSVPDIQNASGNLAGYFFYETYDGYKFKSIDKLFEQKPKRILIYNDIMGEIPPGYDGKTLEYIFSSSLDLDNILLSGSLLKTKLKGLNTYESSYRENEADSTNQFNVTNNGGKEKPLIGKTLGIQEQSSRIIYKLDDPGFLVNGNKLLDQLPRSTYVNYNNDDILRQSIMRYNNLYSTKLSIAIAGDFSLRAGDLIYCDFPEISNSRNKLVSQKISGIYMISDLCHRLTKSSCFTRLNLIRDSIGRKPFK